MSEPKYKKIARDLLAKIQNGTYPEGSLIPKEMALIDQFGVSRPTVRQAIQQLVDQGYLEKKRKRGTMVKRTKIAQEFTHVIQSYNQEMSAKGLTTQTKVLLFQQEPATAEVQAALGLAETAPVYKLLRLRFANNQPVVLVTSYLPVAPLATLAQIDFTQRSLYAELASRKLAITNVRRKLEVLAADETTAALLNVPEQAPLFYFHTQGHTADGTTLEYSIAKYRGDLNYFVFDIDQNQSLQSVWRN
ncbi:GntR family transcriptional regulator [Loigolactobacillus bifermentans]|jgi:GntR family transcriptional regulator|uniref:Transcriptional regulator n=1 Tax=Loigolactobacillus bifermentans DSM 20003 TaxID=1423726 RepID=A0A0R1GYQ9_9LACO|nr:GntR family transcriptional regulator [Loigolactobacillus bifermentans]KRK39430.1 transcriptional regulator [Loigolactobacillus bifermentans DSM 20003]QGG61198.1 UTRA domain-containing protein [Loigolactobacillus bifermentans]